MTLHDHLRQWADQIHRCAALAARASVPTHPDLTNAGDGPDWLRMTSVRERAVLEALMADGVWAPKEEDE